MTSSFYFYFKDEIVLRSKEYSDKDSIISLSEKEVDLELRSREKECLNKRNQVDKRVNAGLISILGRNEIYAELDSTRFQIEADRSSYKNQFDQQREVLFNSVNSRVDRVVCRYSRKKKVKGIIAVKKKESKMELVKLGIDLTDEILIFFNKMN